MMALAMQRFWVCERPTPLANMGGPRSRSRTEQVISSLLGKRDGLVQCPRTRFLGVGFDKDVDPLALAYEALAKIGCQSPEDLRERFDLPPGPCLVAPSQRTPKLKLALLSDDALLAEFLLLGLCTKSMYDPRRPVVWTRASLSRRLEMFQTGGFYALD